MKKERVAILGASDDPSRYSYKAYRQLLSKGHDVFLISPKFDKLDDHRVYDKPSDLNDIDTLTMYVNPRLSSQLEDEILKLLPSRVIFNPGSENMDLAKKLEEKGTRVEMACTLVLLSTDQF